jgi:hypothetical protein
MAESLDEGEEIISELFPVRESREEGASGTTRSFLLLTTSKDGRIRGTGNFDRTRIRQHDA